MGIYALVDNMSNFFFFNDFIEKSNILFFIVRLTAECFCNIR